MSFLSLLKSKIAKTSSKDLLLVDFFVGVFLKKNTNIFDLTQTHKEIFEIPNFIEEQSKSYSRYACIYFFVCFALMFGASLMQTVWPKTWLMPMIFIFLGFTFGSISISTNIYAVLNFKNLSNKPLFAAMCQELDNYLNALKLDYPRLSRNLSLQVSLRRDLEALRLAKEKEKLDWYSWQILYRALKTVSLLEFETKDKELEDYLNKDAYRALFITPEAKSIMEEKKELTKLAPHATHKTTVLKKLKANKI